MASRIDAGADAKRREMYMVTPDEIKTDPKNTGRHDAPSEDEIKRLAIDIHRNGQLQPVVCRKYEGHKLALVAGNNRYKAIMMLRKGFTFEEEDDDGKMQKVKVHEPEMQIQVVVKNLNEFDAFLANISENNLRKQTTPIDDAYNQERLRDVHGWSDSKIAQFYQWNQTKVSHYKQLIQLNPDAQQLVSSGKMAVSAALTLLKLPEDRRQEAIKAAVNGDGKVSGAKVTEQLREHVQESGDDAAPDTKGRARKRTGNRPAQIRRSQKEMREAIRLLNELHETDGADQEHDPVLYDIFLPFSEYMEGVIDFDQMVGSMRGNLKVWHNAWKEEG